MSVKEWLFAKNHGSKHTTQTPHVQRIVIILHKEVRLLEGIKPLKHYRIAT